MRAKKAPEGFEPSISCLLDRRFNQLSHGANCLVLKHVQGMNCIFRRSLRFLAISGSKNP